MRPLLATRHPELAPDQEREQSPHLRVVLRDQHFGRSRWVHGSGRVICRTRLRTLPTLDAVLHLREAAIAPLVDLERDLARDRLEGSSRGECPPVGCLHERLVRLFVGLADRQDHVHLRAVALSLALGPDPSSVELDEFLNQREADPRSLVPPRRRPIHLGEPVEHPLELRSRDSDPGVRDADVEPLLARLAGDHDPSPLRELEGVPDQVDDDLLECVGIHEGERDVPEAVELERDPLPLRRRPRTLDQLRSQPRQIDGGPMDREVLALDLRQVEEVVDQLEEPHPVRIHRAQRPVHRVRNLPEIATAQRIQRSQHQGEGRAELVVDVRGEARLRLVELPELVGCGFELLPLLEVREPHPVQHGAADHPGEPRRREEEEMQAELAPGNRTALDERNRDVAGEERGDHERRLPAIDRQERSESREQHDQADVVAARCSAGAECHEQQHRTPAEAGCVP